MSVARQTLASTSDESLRAALDEADLRVLLAVLVQITGDRRWIEAPFRPVRDVRLIADPAAGLPTEVQERIREAAFELLRHGPVDPAIDEPDEDLFVEMMSVCLGEQVPREYVPMMLHEMGFRGTTTEPLEPAVPEGLAAIIIGAGVSGIAAAVRLGQLGVPYVVLEKNRDVGGTWFENRYPDCGVDTPNHFYSFSFAPEPDWNHYFSRREEIHGYLMRCVDEFGVRPNVRFGAAVTGARWDDDAQDWVVEVTSGAGADVMRAPILISAVGQLNRPRLPDIPGLDEFDGECFHSADWPDDIALRGKRVAVVGAGASSMQLVPRVAEEAEHLVVFQRSKQWVRPIDQYRSDVTDGIKWLMANVPFYLRWYRFTLAWRYGDGLHRTLKRDPSWPHPERSLNRTNERHRVELESYYAEQLLGHEDLLPKLVPAYPPYAKRMLIDNGWFTALKDERVELVTDTISRVESRGVVTADGTLYEADVLVLATGFHALDFLGEIDVVGRGGRRLRDRWGDDDARAYLGMTVPEFPNLFVLYGPNTNLAHGGSIIFHAECQVRYLTSLIRQLASSGGSSVEVRSDIHDAYNARVDAAHEHLVWTHPGVDIWYRNRRGRVVSNSPWRLVDYWNMTAEAALEEYLVETRPAIRRGVESDGVKATESRPRQQA
jgi:4-hydroxyacetophenone monooxygenase